MAKQWYLIYMELKTKDISYTNIFDWNMNKTTRYKGCTSIGMAEGKRDLYKQLKELGQ